jgi:hypothetical protein
MLAERWKRKSARDQARINQGSVPRLGRDQAADRKAISVGRMLSPVDVVGKASLSPARMTVKPGSKKQKPGNAWLFVTTA